MVCVLGAADTLPKSSCKRDLKLRYSMFLYLVAHKYHEFNNGKMGIEYLRMY